MNAARLRVPNSGWFRSWDDRLVGALCRVTPSPSWTADLRPSDADLAEMAQLCEQCPVKAACAEYALNKYAPAQGGMYAGVWIPWRTPDGGKHSRNIGWQNARWELRRRLRQWAEADNEEEGLSHGTKHNSGRRSKLAGSGAPTR